METTGPSLSHTELDWAAARVHFGEVDPILDGLASGLTDPTHAERRPAFDSLCRAIVGQQLSVKAAATIWQRLKVLHGGAPTPEAILASGLEDHRNVGVSGQKHNYLMGLAARYLDCPDDFNCVRDHSDDDIIERWTEVKGLGKWTVQMHLMFQLNRPDVFPVDDLGIRRSMELHFGIPRNSPKSMYEKRALVWSPFRTAACRFLWMSLDNQPK